MDATNILFIQRLVILAFAASIGALISRVAWKRGYYQMPSDALTSDLSNPSALLLRHLIAMFAIFLIVELLVAPFGYTLWESYEQGVSPFAKELETDQNGRTWMNVWGA